jgi:hypothetical protein
VISLLAKEKIAKDDKIRKPSFTDSVSIFFHENCLNLILMKNITNIEEIVG